MNLVNLAPLAVLLPLIGAAITFVLFRHARLQRTVSIATLVLTISVEAAVLVHVGLGQTQVVSLGGWQPPFGIVMVVDQFSAFMLVVSSIVSLLVLVYATGQGISDGEEDNPMSIFHPTYLILVAGVSNAFLAGDLFNLYVSFEVLLVASYVLLTMGGTGARLRAGVTYLVVSVVSSILFLISIGLIYSATGTLNLAHLALRLSELDQGTQTVLHLLLLVAFGVKAAVFPLSFWLPDSYPTAPAPVTAVFAGLLTKVGVYAIIRTETLLFPGGSLSDVLLVVALLTMIVGILGAVAQTDIKRLLSFTLISHIGYMIFGVALGSVLGLAAAIFYTAHHILVQTSLFLAAGLIERRGGSTSLQKLGGLAKLSPLLALLYFVPALNLGGIPPFSGFLGKLGLLQAGIDKGTVLAYVVVGGAVFASLLTLYSVLKVWNKAFWRSVSDVEFPDPILVENISKTTRVSLLPKTMTLSTAVLMFIGVSLTVFSAPIYELSVYAAQTLLDSSNYIDAVFGDRRLP